MLAEQISDNEFEVGRVISRTFSEISRNWIVLAIIGAGTAGLSTIMGTLLMRDVINAAALQTNPGLIFTSYGYWGSLIGGLILNAFASSAILCALLSREEAELPEVLGGAFKFILPMLALSIISTLGFMIGLVLLVVPGIILMTVWSVSGPALVAERVGIFEALGRSRALTKGIRWKVFGALVIFSIVFWIVIFAIQGLAGGGMALYSGSPFAFIIGTISATISTIGMPSFLASLYVETINAKGGRESELAGVFQ